MDAKSKCLPKKIPVFFYQPTLLIFQTSYDKIVKLHPLFFYRPLW